VKKRNRWIDRMLVRLKELEFETVPGSQQGRTYQRASLRLDRAEALYFMTLLSEKLPMDEHPLEFTLETSE
jgi:hypothetical protein